MSVLFPGRRIGKTQTSSHLRLLGEIANQLTAWQRNHLQERRNGDNLILGSSHWLLVDVDNFKMVPARYFRFADTSEIPDGAGGAGCGTCHVQAKLVTLRSGFFEPALELRHSICWLGLLHLLTTMVSALLTDVQSDQYFFGVGEVPDDFSDGMRELPHQCGNSEDLIAFSKLRVY